MRRIKFLFVFIVGALLFGVSLWRFPLVLQDGRQLLAAVGADLFLMATAVAAGRALLQEARLIHRSLLEELIFSLALGLITLSLLGSALGAAGVYFDWVAWLVLGAVLLTRWEHIEHFSAEFLRQWRAKRPWDGGNSEVFAVMAGVLGLVAVLGLCLVPVTFFDALNYHLAGVQRAAQLGRHLPQADHLFTWLPDLAQPLWTFATLLAGNPLSNTQAPALLNFMLLMALGLALADASSRWVAEGKHWVAPALAWTQPIIALSFGVFSPDGWMAFFGFLSCVAFLSATEEKERRAQGAWLALAALTAGAACASKLVAAIHVAALALLFVYEAWKRPAWRRATWTLVGGGLVALPLLPWLLMGAWYKHNPVYPMKVGAFGHTWLAGGPEAYFQHMDGFAEPLWRLPWDFFFRPMVLGGNGHLSWLILALGLSAWAWKWTEAQRRLGVYVALSLGLWLMGPWVLRFGLFAMPAACLLAAKGVLEVETWALSKTWTHAWRALVLAGLFLGAGQGMVIATRNFDPWKAAMGIESREAYLARYGIIQAQAAAWLAKRPAGRLLVLGDSRTAYLPAKSLSASQFDTHPFKGWAAKATSPQDLGAIVRRKGYDFVLLNRAWWASMGDHERPLYWDRDDLATARRVDAWLQSLTIEPGRKRLELGRGAGWIIDLR